MSKIFYHEEWANTASLLGLILYPIVIIAMLMSNHYGYSEFKLKSYNKFFLLFSCGYMVVFVKIDEFFKKKYVNQDLIKTDDKYEYKDQYTIFMAILYWLFCFFQSAFVPAMFLTFVLLYSK